MSFHSKVVTQTLAVMRRLWIAGLAETTVISERTLPLTRAAAYATAILVHNSRASRCGSFSTRHSVSIIIVARSAAV